MKHLSLKMPLASNSISGSCVERSAVFQATREAAAAYSDLHQGRLGEVNKERSSDVDCEEAKLVKSDGKSK